MPGEKPEAVPDWVTETPEDLTYDLVMYDARGGSLQQVAMTRDEYITLKGHLAKIRGYVTSGHAGGAD